MMLLLLLLPGTGTTTPATLELPQGQGALLPAGNRHLHK